MVTRADLLEQDISGNGKTWKKRVQDACREFGYQVIDLFHEAGKAWHEGKRAPRVKKEVRGSLELYQQRRKLRRNKEPFVPDFVRAFVAYLFRQQKLATA